MRWAIDPPTGSRGRGTESCTPARARGLTGGCGAYQLGLLFYEPAGIKVATPRERRPSRDGVTVLSRRSPDREVIDAVPYVSMAELLLEIAAEGNVPILRRTLEALDYRNMLDIGAAYRVCGHGRSGSTLLKRALSHRLPQLALCKSPLEVDFLIDLIEAHHLPLPRVNSQLHGVEPDMYWPHLNLVVELDGRANHHSAAQRRRDEAKDELLRSHGITVIRLSDTDVHHRQASVLRILASHHLMPAR